MGFVCQGAFGRDEARIKIRVTNRVPRVRLLDRGNTLSVPRGDEISSDATERLATQAVIAVICSQQSSEQSQKLKKGRPVIRTGRPFFE